MSTDLLSLVTDRLLGDATVTGRTFTFVDAALRGPAALEAAIADTSTQVSHPSPAAAPVRPRSVHPTALAPPRHPPAARAPPRPRAHLHLRRCGTARSRRAGRGDRRHLDAGFASLARRRPCTAPLGPPDRHHGRGLPGHRRPPDARGRA